MVVLPFISSASRFNNFEECLYYPVSGFVFTVLRETEFQVRGNVDGHRILFTIFWKGIIFFEAKATS